MGNRITASGLAAMLAIATGKQKDLCESFVGQLFAIVEEELTKGENVRIKGFGTFKLVEVEPRKSVNVVTGEDYEIPGHTKVIFVMAKELAAIVNAPFEAFEAVEIADELPTDDLDGDVEVDCSDIVDCSENKETDVDDSEANEAVEIPSTPVADIPEEIIQEEEKGAEESTAIVDTPTEIEETSEAEETPGPMEAYEAEESAEQDETEEDTPFWKRYKFIVGFIAGMCASVLIGWLAISLADYLKPSSQSEKEIVEIEEENPNKLLAFETNDSIAEKNDSLGNPKVESSDLTSANQEEAVPTKPSDEPVYDTVSTTRYLTTIAKAHYGNFNLWPIIYEENASILGHPDRIRPGTKVVVPPLSKYGIDPDNKEQVREVKERGKAIYAKFK